MLNEFVYCPRLFYFEWVDDRWADSADTEQGRFTHRAVDRPVGAMPQSPLDDWLGQARSVRIEDAEFGLVAVLDRVEFSDGTTVPVEVKSGRPTPAGGPWPADRIQVLVHVVLLRRRGFTVPSAVIYYAATNQRVDVEIPADVEGEIRHLMADAKRIAAGPRPPLPLLSSPKCPRCSLVGLCLPDETNALLERAELPPRRILPRDPAQRPVYVTEQGAFVGVSGGRLHIKRDREMIADIRLLDVSQLAIFGRVQVSSEAMARLWDRGCPVLWFSYNGWLRGWSTGEPSKYVELRLRQVIAHVQGALPIAHRMIEGKIANQRTLLRRNARIDVASVVASLAGLRQKVNRTDTLESLLGIEGVAARLYFDRLPVMLSERNAEFAAAFDANGRQRRPSPDPVNATLSFCYGLLVKDLVAVCLAVGLDPFIGVLHRPRFGKPALALDLAEEFRPLIADSVTLSLFNNGELVASDFVQSSRGVFLTSDARKAVVRAYERRLDQEVKHPVFGYTISYRRVMDVQARILAAVFIGEIPDYTPMVTR